MKPCPECGSTDREEEPGEFALLGVTQGQIQLHTDAPDTTVAVVRVTVCKGCGYVTLHESA